MLRGEQPVICKKGDIRHRVQLGWDRELRIDGKAKIIRPINDGKSYRYVVQFMGKDRKRYERFIDPMGEEDPEATSRSGTPTEGRNSPSVRAPGPLNQQKGNDTQFYPKTVGI